tara:strand:- start:1508 stop:1681 length:174 start_codon:yes stop_codon:yes gene_type:complete
MDELISAMHLLTEEISKLRSEISLQKDKDILLKERKMKKEKALEMMQKLERQTRGDC